MKPTKMLRRCAVPAALLAAALALHVGAARADEPGSGRVSPACSRASSDALCARTLEWPRWPLAPLASAARAEEPDTDSRQDEAPLELATDAPLDLSTPEPEPRRGNIRAPLAAKPPATGWGAIVGVDDRKAPIPAVEWQPEPLVAAAIPDRTTGVGWANVTAPGLDAPLGWDKTSIETRVDPAQEQGKLATTLSRAVPVGDDVLLTLENGISVTRTLPGPTQPLSQSWASSQALRLNIVPTDTTFSVGADMSSTDDKWLRTLSAEQKLFGGPISVTGAVSETAAGDTSTSLKARFKRTW